MKRKAEESVSSTALLQGKPRFKPTRNDPVVVAVSPSLLVDAQKTDKPACAGGGECSEGMELLPQHRIFLSHSGAQKPFVEQLCKDLENAGHFPFFDRRPDSLPKGKKFPGLIKDAASQCHVAVVVLSEDYLLSKWPMIELTEFVRSIKDTNPDMKILPLFYKIGVEDLKLKHDHVMSEWEGLCKKDTRLNYSDADDALRFLSSVNGEVFAGDSELAYREAIVASICKLCPPDVQFDLSAMQGRKRLCEVVVAEFDKRSTEGASSSSSSEAHARVVGVHGIGGAGKTLLCQALCNVYSGAFAGRVLHIELKRYKDLKQEHIIEAQKSILKSLTAASPDLLENITSVEQGSNSLRTRLPRQDVFLALDNVPEESTGPDRIYKWVQILLSCLSPRSKAIVTSRGLVNLKNAIPLTNVSYVHVPSLDDDEALRIFQRYALAPARLVSSFTVEEMEVLKSCIERCFFVSEDATASGPLPGHYHPLSLQALGSYLKGIDDHNPLQWLHKSKISKILKERELFDNYSVFDILRAGYDALPSELDKLLFLDIAVFAPRGKLNNVDDLCVWLAAVHGIDEDKARDEMKNLRMKSLIQDWEKNTGTSNVTVHDLYVDFAEHQIHSEESARRCVYERNGRTIPSRLESAPSGLRWPDLVRLRLQTSSMLSFPSEKFPEWSNLVVLDINLIREESLDLSPLNRLRSLKLKSFVLKTLKWSDKLQWLQYVKLSCRSLVQTPDFSACSGLRELYIQLSSPAAISLVGTLPGTLQVLRMVCSNPRFPALLELGSMPSLEVVEIVNNCHKFPSGPMVIEGLSSLTRLRILSLKNLPIRGSIAGLESLVSLEVLFLERCQALNALPGLGKLTNLQHLDVSRTAIESLPGLKELSHLRRLRLADCKRLEALPDLRPFKSLKEVAVNGCTLLSSPLPVPERCILISDSTMNTVAKAMTKPLVEVREEMELLCEAAASDNVLLDESTLDRWCSELEGPGLGTGWPDPLDAAFGQAMSLMVGAVAAGVHEEEGFLDGIVKIFLSA